MGSSTKTAQRVIRVIHNRVIRALQALKQFLRAKQEIKPATALGIGEPAPEKRFLPQKIAPTASTTTAMG